MTSKSLRFSSLKIEGVESDLLNYHIKFLLTKKYVQKNDNEYSLTEKGTKYISNTGIDGINFNLFKVSVAIYLVVREKILVQERKRKPFLNQIFTVSGKVMWGEKIEDCAKRKLFEETGLISDFKLIGINRKIRLNSKKEVIEDTIYHICFADNYEGTLINDNEYGNNYWLDINDAVKEFEKNPDFGKYDREIINRILNKDYTFFYFQQVKEIDSY